MISATPMSFSKLHNHPPSQVAGAGHPSCGRPQDNRLLAALPEADRESMAAALEQVPVAAGHVLCGAGLVSNYVYFPVDCIVSILYLTQDGETAEVAVVGSEGMVGMNIFVGGSSGSSEVLVQCSGSAYRIRAATLREHFDRSPEIRDLLMQYMQVLLAQSAQTALCNRHHTVEQQLCRWLLTASDRLGSSELTITQESIANTLGVRRAGITEAACRLQKDGLVRYRRGKLELLDRARMERRACECYATLQRELERLAPTAVGSPANGSRYARPGMGHHAQPPRYLMVAAPPQQSLRQVRM